MILISPTSPPLLDCKLLKHYRNFRNRIILILNQNSSGDFQRVQSCPSAFVVAYMTSFSLRVQLPFNGTDTTQGDRTAANNIRFLCSNDREINGVGNTDGVWGDYSESCPEGICGMETRVQPFQGGIGHYDNTALNDVRFTCCPEGPPMTTTSSP
jgi:hypothetical protein